MIKTEKQKIKNKEYYYTYSDNNKMIRDSDNNLYISAYDIVQKDYVETDIDIESESDD